MQEFTPVSPMLGTAFYVPAPAYGTVPYDQFLQSREQRAADPTRQGKMIFLQYEKHQVERLALNESPETDLLKCDSLTAYEYHAGLVLADERPGPGASPVLKFTRIGDTFYSAAALKFMGAPQGE